MEIDPGTELFERLCAQLALDFDRLPESGVLGEQRPDFAVRGADGTAFYAEVKTISPTPEEAEQIRRVDRGGIGEFGGTPGSRLRSLITKVNGQLKALARDARPGVLVVFNPELSLSWHTEPYAVLTAMRGLDVVDVHVPRDARLAPQFGPVRPGPRKMMTDRANTSTSAVFCPREVAGGEWLVDVFHNRYAARPLSARAVVGAGVRHWSLSSNEHEWELLAPAG